MTDLEPLLRRHFDADAQDAPLVVDLLGSVRKARRRRRRQAAGGMLAVAVVAAAVAVPLAIGGRSTPATVQPAAASSAPPAGTRAVVYGGIELDVPASWGTDDTRCGTPVSDTVVYGGDPTAACAVAAPPEVSSLTLTPGDAAATFDSVVPLPAVTFAGLPARRGTVEAGRTRQVFTVVPSRGVTIEVAGPSPAEIGAILATAHTVRRDALDCPSRRPTPTSGGAPTGVVCEYVGDWLAASDRPEGGQRARLVAALPTTGGTHLQPLVYPLQVGSCRVAVLDAPGLGMVQVVEDGCSTPPGVTGGVTAPLTSGLSEALAAILPTGFRVG